jgi:hypothetical protein
MHNFKKVLAGLFMFMLGSGLVYRLGGRAGPGQLRPMFIAPGFFSPARPGLRFACLGRSECTTAPDAPYAAPIVTGTIFILVATSTACQFSLLFDIFRVQKLGASTDATTIQILPNII